ncbi:hypothetical protein BASA81_010002 [Batrachochytrium salamandrivorans]|nr:hypothetical protein BASA81_010002 [Batrachochytrium salamandrivorans]
MQLLLLLLVLAVLVSSQSLGNAKRQEFMAKVSPSTNVADLRNLADYKKFITRSGRDYDAFVLLTASKVVGCHVCPEWEAAFEEVALTYKSQLSPEAEERILFARVTYNAVPDVFQMYKLNHAPMLLYVNSGNKKPDTLDPKASMNLANLEAAFADPIANFVSQRSGHKVEILYPVWPKILTLAVVLVGAGVFGRRLALVLVPVLRKQKWFWFVFSIILYGLGVSGSIFSYLRNVPNYGVDQKTRQITYFAGDRNQFFYEGIIIWTVLVAAATGMVFSAYGFNSVSWFPKQIQTMRPFLSITALALFALLFKFYVHLYTNKAVWYKHGMANGLTFPWV